MDIAVVEYSGNYLHLSWNVPDNTGVATDQLPPGETGIPILSYQLEVNEGFGSGFVPITGREQSTPAF